jgi:hypothetical protein
MASHWACIAVANSSTSYWKSGGQHVSGRGLSTLPHLSLRRCANVTNVTNVELRDLTELSLDCYCVHVTDVGTPSSGVSCTSWLACDAPPQLVGAPKLCTCSWSQLA